MQQVTTYQIVPGQDSALARQKLNFLKGGSIQGIAISLIISLALVVVGIIILIFVKSKVPGII
ncbi:MAG: hypothetical protein EZS28_041014, partial [Streblomastix strix]